MKHLTPEVPVVDRLHSSSDCIINPKHFCYHNPNGSPDNHNYSCQLWWKMDQSTSVVNSKVNIMMGISIPLNVGPVTCRADNVPRYQTMSEREQQGMLEALQVYFPSVYRSGSESSQQHSQKMSR